MINKIMDPIKDPMIHVIGNYLNKIVLPDMINSMNHCLIKRLNLNEELLV